MTTWADCAQMTVLASSILDTFALFQEGQIGIALTQLGGWPLRFSANAKHNLLRSDQSRNSGGRADLIGSAEREM